MKKLLLLLIILTACHKLDIKQSQIPEMENFGLYKVKYELSMPLVPCLSSYDTGSKKLSVKERIEYMKLHGGFMADCGKINDDYVWTF